MVGMDIKHTHLEAGLLCKRGKQKFTSEAGVQLEGPNDDNSDAADYLNTCDQDDDLLDFDQLSEHLIAGAASANADKDVLYHFGQFSRPCYVLHACQNFEFGTWGEWLLHRLFFSR